MNLSFLGQSQRTRRTIFVISNLFAVLCVYFILIDPIRELLDERAENIAQRRATLARYQAVSTQEDAVRSFARRVAESNQRGELIAGSSAGIVNANLQARLKTLAEQANVMVRSVQMLPPKSVRGAMLVGARLEAFGALEALHTMVRAIEGEPPLLLVTSATMHGQPVFWGMPNAAGTDAEQKLEVQFDVYGGAALESAARSSSSAPAETTARNSTEFWSKERR